MSDLEDDFENEDSDDEEEASENPELEAAFQKVADAHMHQIEEQLEIAAKAIAKAEKIAEKYGLPFQASVSPLSQSFTPESFWEKFGDLDSDFVMDITDAYLGEEHGEAGWEHSAVCY